MFKFGATRITQSPLACTVKPNRSHKHRWRQSVAYHRRIQKKWTKRFGTTTVPAAYMINGGTLVVHPTIYERIRRAT